MMYILATTEDEAHCNAYKLNTNTLKTKKQKTKKSKSVSNMDEIYRTLLADNHYRSSGSSCTFKLW